MKIRVRDFKRLSNSLVIMLFALFFFYFTSATDTYSSPLPKEVIVSQGDTLWDIAERHYPNDYLPKKTYEIEEINHIEDGTIYPGQKLILP